MFLFLSIAIMRFSEGIYQRFKNVLHPKLRANMDQFEDGGFYYLPTYHGCNKNQNRNGTNKKINYRNGEICSKGTYDSNWEEWEKINYYKLPSKIYFTRYMSEIGINALAKNKGHLWFDSEKKEYRPKSDCYKNQKIEFVKDNSKKVSQLIKNEQI